MMASLLDRCGNAAIEEAEGMLLLEKARGMPTVECVLHHRFAPGVYMREVTMPAGTWVIGHEHLTEHGNVVLSGKAIVSMNGVMQPIEAGDVFVSPSGLRKILIIIETMRFMTIHPNPDNIRDIEVLESMFVRKSATFQEFERLQYTNELDQMKSVIGYLSQEEL